MSNLTGAELGGGLPPPGSTTLIQRTERGKEADTTAVPFSSEAAILQLTNTATTAVVQRGQELVDRRNEKNAAENDEARKAAAQEARNRSLEEQGLKEPEVDENETGVNTLRGGDAADGSTPDTVAEPLGTPSTATADAPVGGEQEPELIDESGHLNVVA
jgi:hypothetical protein